ncbi:MAG: alpha/beta fold hydrolase [Candidatus Eisenbacteria bacterium]
MGKVIFLLLLAALIFAAGSGYIALYPPVPQDLGGVENLDAKAERFRIPVGEDDALDAFLLQGRRSALIVIFHGYGRDHTRAWRYAQFLKRGGYAVLTVNFRSSRGWNRKPTTLGWYELNDARAVLDWVRSHPRLSQYSLGLFGESLGGSVALVAASRHPEVRAVCVDAPFATGERALADASWRWAHMPPWPSAPLARALGKVFTRHDPYELDAVAAARAIADRPTLFIHSQKDERFDESQARDLWKAAGSDHEGLWILGGEVGHNESWIMHRAEYEERVLAFYQRHLKGEPVQPFNQAALDAGRMLGEGAAAAGRAVVSGARKGGQAAGDATPNARDSK